MLRKKVPRIGSDEDRTPQDNSVSTLMQVNFINCVGFPSNHHQILTLHRNVKLFLSLSFIQKEACQH
jgi:hypothetical protein